MTPADLYAAIRRRLDLENTDYLSDLELGQAAEESYLDLWDFSIGVLGDEAPWERSTLSTVAGQDFLDVTLATGCYRILRLEFRGSGACWAPVQRLTLASDLVDPQATPWTSADSFRYFARRSTRSPLATRSGTAGPSYAPWKIYFSPVPAAVYQLRLYSLPPPDIRINIAVPTSPYTQFPDDFPEYVIADVCAKLRGGKEEGDASAFLLERDRIKDRIERYLKPHQLGAPAFVADLRQHQADVEPGREFWRNR